MCERHWLALCGSLRARSSNKALLTAAAQLLPSGIAMMIYDGMADLPLFNPDLEEGDVALPESVCTLRGQVDAAELVLIACPEYAHGIPGAFKNLLDWLVGSPTFSGKPVALLNAASRANHAQSQLVEILTTMSARLAGSNPYLIALPHNGFDAAQILAEIKLAGALKNTLAEIAESLNPPAPSPDRS